jgi:hypothetical protein
VKTLGHIPLAVGHDFPHRLWKACGKAAVDIQEDRVVIADSPVCTDVVRPPDGGAMRAAIYARVSTFDQEPENQLAEVRRVRFSIWFSCHC